MTVQDSPCCGIRTTPSLLGIGCGLELPLPVHPASLFPCGAHRRWAGGVWEGVSRQEGSQNQKFLDYASLAL